MRILLSWQPYAPLFAHVKDWQWTPNLIWFDNRTSYATPNYYVQQLFSLNKGTHTVPVTENNHTIAGTDSIWASSVIDRNSNEVIIKLVSPSSSAKNKTIAIGGLKKKITAETISILKGEPGGVNNLQEEIIRPQTNQIEVKNNVLKAEVPAYSFVVYRIKM